MTEQTKGQTWTVNAAQPVSFTIYSCENILDPNNKDLLRFNNSNRRLVIIDKTVNGLYGQQVIDYFKTNKIELCLFEIDATEENKNWNNTNTVLQFLEDNNVLRREPIIAIGGGVLLDIVGFCAGVYRRGIPYIKVPTTLLGIVDASIGTKVAVNHFDRRNRIGTYYPPIASLLDKKFIATQDERNIVNGIAEIFKMAVIKDEQLFSILENHANELIETKFQSEHADAVINLAVTDMVQELTPNLWERNLERAVDYGHSFSPIIEMKNLPNLFHGEAVVLDCLFSACLALIRKHITQSELDRIFETARSLKLPTYHKDFVDVNTLKLALSDTVKHRNGNQYLPVPLSIGNNAILNNVTGEEIYSTIKIFQNYENSRNNRNI